MPSATLVKFEQFAVDVANKVHDLFGINDTLKAMLSNVAPNVGTGAVYADITQIANGNGYTTGGIDIQNDGTETPAGTVTVTAGIDPVWTGSGAGMAPFRYVVLYNDTPVSPVKPLIGYYDYGSAVTVGVGETFTLNFGTSVLTIT